MSSIILPTQENKSPGSSLVVSSAIALSGPGNDHPTNPVADLPLTVSEEIRTQLNRTLNPAADGDTGAPGNMLEVGSQIIQSSLTLADVVADFAPVPCLKPLVGCLKAVFQAVDQSAVNRKQWKLLRDQCLIILNVIGRRMLDQETPNLPDLKEPIELFKSTLRVIAERVEQYNKMNGLLSFLKYQAISGEIQGFFAQLDYCLKMFSLGADVANAQWLSDLRTAREQETKDIEALLDRLNVDIDAITLKIDELALTTRNITTQQSMIQHDIQNLDMAMRQLFKEMYSLLQGAPQPQQKKYIEAKEIICTILSVAGLRLPPKILLGKQCIVECGENVAKKVFRLGVSDQQTVEHYATRIMRIASLWYDLRCDYTLPFYGLWMEEDGPERFQLYMVSPWMDNMDAMTYLRRYRKVRNLKTVILQIITDAAMGLQYLHTREKPVVHSGMKGSNILISDSGRGILGGFGLTKALTSSSASTVLMTGVSDAKRWMAPEMMDQQPVLTVHCDVWGWAMAALEIISGKIPYYQFKHNNAVRSKVKAGPPKRKHYPEFDDYAYKPDEMWELLEGCWAKVPEERLHITKIVEILEDISRM
ncbi:Putative serine/threonine-protein kinase/receptor R818 [Rhizoctonia solani]|uniref:Putative serine/threonine-protein kinase/receptor R818 n=1 Tax=Rhizoctonia solani TaxID=456999 RepID=A0A0K6G8S9_9AGAM|nr:Putative serine/threonine-protein kinase/receptor R818 [Rhizoctonia solani]